MSDSRRRYDAVTAKLRQLLPELWLECASRMINLSLMVSAIPKAKDLTQPALAAEMPHQRLVPLVTDLALPQETRYWYDKRYWIEPLFGDIKGHGFDLQTSRLRDPDRLSRLMLAVSLAYLWLCFLGSVALMTGQAKLVDRTDRRDRSVFTIGRLWLNRLLKLDLPFLVGFCPYPFLNLSAPPGASC